MRRRWPLLLAAGLAAGIVGVTAAWAGFPNILDFDEPQLVYGPDSGAAPLARTTSSASSTAGAFDDPRVLVENIVVVAKEGVQTTLTAAYAAVYVCVAGSGHVPRPVNGTTLVNSHGASATFPAAKNGRATGSLLTDPLPSGAEAAAATGYACPAGQTLEFDRVVFSDLVLAAEGGEVIELDVTLTSVSVYGLT